MRSVIAAILAFSLLIVAQVVVWKARKRRGHYTSLSVLSILVLIVSLAGFRYLQTTLSGPTPLLPLEYWNFALLYTAMALSYMITYSAVQADSPTMAILLQMEQAGARGCGREEILAQLNDAVLILPRLDDLVIGHLVVRSDDRYTITERGSLLARIYMFYRTLLKMRKGG